MKKHTKAKIRNLINLEEKDGLTKTIKRLQNRYRYLLSKRGRLGESRQMKYIQFHMKKYQKMYQEGIR
jgi:hypothetical protein